MILNVLGCMGIGKTTVIEAIAKEYNGRIIPEQFENNPYWKAAYAGEQPEFLKMQIQFMNQYIETLLMLSHEDHEGKLIILDQCFYTLPFIMTQNALGLINDVDKDCYLQRWALLRRTFMPVLGEIANVILWDTNKNIYKKLQDRGREAEKGIPFDFIQKMSACFRSPEYMETFVSSYLIRSEMGWESGVVTTSVCGLEKGEIPGDIRELLRQGHVLCAQTGGGKDNEKEII